MKTERVRQIIELITEIVWIIINRKRNKTPKTENNDSDNHSGPDIGL